MSDAARIAAALFTTAAVIAWNAEFLSAPSALLAATRSPERSVVHLPFVLKSPACRFDAVHVDVALVLDRSTSMQRTIEPGTVTKNEAAIEAAIAFVGLLDLTPDAAGRSDQVAVVGFNDAAWTEQPLTADRDAAATALGRIADRLSDGTRLDLAFDEGQRALEGPQRRTGNRALIVLLTDGLPNRVPFGPNSPYPGSTRQEDSVLQTASAAKARGTRVYTVGLGSEADLALDLLEACASEPSMSNHAPRPEDLEAIYARIAAARRVCDPVPTATLSIPTVAPTPTPTPTPLPTVTPTACIPRESHADVSLILDMSTSMNRPTRDGRTKQEAAIEAARTFIGRMRLTPDESGGYDQVAVSGFHGESWTSVGLTHDIALAEAALVDLVARMDRGTRLDLAFVQAQAALDAGPRVAGSLPVIILLTDGQANGVPADPGTTADETVLERAQRAKTAGSRVFTIGLGGETDVDRVLLAAAASDPSLFFEAPDGEDVAAIYRQIAGQLTGCP